MRFYLQKSSNIIWPYLYITPNGVSDANGLVTATLNLGANKANRIITVSAIVDGVSTIGTVDVTGTTISIAGNGSMALNASTNLTFTVKDSAGVPMPNIPVTLTSSNLNTIVQALPNTNAAGVVSATVTAKSAGIGTITAVAAGVTNSATLNVSADSFAFVNPTGLPLDIPLGVVAAPNISVTWTNALGAVSGVPVNFYSTRGTITPAVSAVAGVATATASSTAAGAAILTASGPGGIPSATMQVNFVATTASTVTTQAVPGIVQITTGSVAQTSNSSVISAVVKDIAGNLVKNATVAFSLVDPTGGTLNSPTAITDINGLASVTYTAGTTSSPQNGVTITANVPSVGGVAQVVPASSATLTVSNQALFVRIGFDNLITVSANPPINTKIFSAIVIDTAGNAVPAQTVRFVMRPILFRKGFYSLPSPAQIAAAAAQNPPITLPSGWAQYISATCINEDLNSNSLLDAGEDYNGDLALTPGTGASITATGITDANGVATATIAYPRSFASWVQVVIEARTGVVGNDPPTRTQPFWLPGLGADYLNTAASPPDHLSPFGTSALAAVPAKAIPAGFAGQSLGCDNAN